MAEHPYHSAQLPQVGAKPRQACADGLVFVHDLLSSTTLPGQYAGVSAIYADLPWAQGFATFNKRAGISDGRTFAEFLDHLDKLAADADRPVFLVTSPTGAGYLSSRRYPITLDRPGAKDVKATVVAYNTVAPLERTTSKLIERLCRDEASVGDFCCGYGTTVRSARRWNTPFVASDYSAEAVGYVCANYRRWH